MIGFHGTRLTDPKVIINSDVGFDINFSRPGNYGKGLYFAKQFSYCADRNYAYSKQEYPESSQIGSSRLA